LQINFFERIIGSGFYSGYSPIASGTAGSLAALLIYFIPGFEKLYIIISFSVLFFFIGIPIGSKFEKIYGKDPAQCTIDEFVGTWISLIALPKTVPISITAFLIWRVLDILKPPPARKFEQFKGGFGIMIDDVISAIYTLFIMHVIVYLVGYF
jgi:phosphatidylglycerophosphatase A